MLQAGSTSRRRRGSAFVTRNACNECKKRKARCDGKDPCARCLTRHNVICEYTVSVRVSKEEMKAHIEKLELSRKRCEYILGLLASGPHSQFILQQLQNGERVENICDDLFVKRASFDFIGSNSRKGIDVSSGSSETGDQSLAYSNSPMRVEDGPGFGCLMAGEERRDDILYADKPWTAVTPDVELLEHLISLYFCWEYPTFSSLSKEHFLRDFEIGRHRFCSPLLVNILSALGCRFSDRLIVRRAQVLGQLLGDQFYAEAERLWEKEQFDPSLTTIQATGLMSLWETSCGRDNRSSFYSKQAIIMAIEMGIHLRENEPELSEAEDEVRSATFWGAFVLDQAWSLSLGRCPHLSGGRFKMRPPVFGEDQGPWVPYTDNWMQVENTAPQPSNTCSIFNIVCKLSVIICRSLHMIHASRVPLTSRDVLSIYTEYLGWYDSLPQDLRRGQNSTPAVLFMHMYYHFAILLLFRPFFNLLLLGSNFIPKNICVEAADAIGSLINTYRRLYGLCRTPSFVPHISLASSIVRLATTENRVSIPTKSLQGISDLQEMIPSHMFASRAMEVLSGMIDISEVGEENSKHDIASQASSSKASIYFFSLGMRESAPYYHPTPEYSIFSPFPPQVLALAPSREELRSNGFELRNESHDFFVTDTNECMPGDHRVNVQTIKVEPQHSTNHETEGM